MFLVIHDVHPCPVNRNDYLIFGKTGAREPVGDVCEKGGGRREGGGREIGV